MPCVMRGVNSQVDLILTDWLALISVQTAQRLPAGSQRYQGRPLCREFLLLYDEKLLQMPELLS